MYGKIEINNNSIIGIDLGITKGIATFDGNNYTTYNLPVNIKLHYKKMKILQKELSRRQGKIKSMNWIKTKNKIALLHRKIANIRNNFQHHVSKDFVKNYSNIIIEDLKVKNMSKSAKGNILIPGKNVKAKSGLNREILKQGWSATKLKIEYKCNWYNKNLIKINPRYTSQTCPDCKNIDKKNRKTQEHFKCVCCGFTLNADYTAAMNIRDIGLKILTNK